MPPSLSFPSLRLIMPLPLPALLLKALLQGKELKVLLEPATKHADQAVKDLAAKLLKDLVSAASSLLPWVPGCC